MLSNRKELKKLTEAKTPIKPAQQTATVRYMIGRYQRPITWYLCCPHCEPCNFVNQHMTPCQHVDGYGHKDCVVGQMPK